MIVAVLASLSVTAQKRLTMDWYQNFFEDLQPPIENALRQANANLQESIETNDFERQATSYKELGMIALTRTHDLEQAMNFFIRSLSLEDSLGHRPNQVFSYLGIAEVFEEAGDYSNSKDALEQAQRINDEFHDVPTLVWILNKLGRINGMRGRLEEAFENYGMVLQYKDQVDPEVEAEALFNLAHLYQIQQKYNEALDHHKNALAIFRSGHDRAKEARSLNDIGELYWVMKNGERALANHVAALEIRQGLKDKEGTAESYNNIGNLYYQQRNLPRSIANLELGLDAAREAQSHEQMKASYELLSRCYEEQGDFKKALENKNRFMAIEEMIQSEMNERQLAETQKRYLLERSESQIEKLDAIRVQREKELLDQMRIRNFLFVIIGLGVVIVGLGFYLYLQKQQSNKLLKTVNTKVQQQNTALQELNATKDKFFSIISHDLKGPLNSLTSFSRLLINHSESLSKEEIQMLAKDLDKSLKNLFALLENLLEWSRSQTGNIEFKPEVFSITDTLVLNRDLLTAQAQNKGITLIVEPREEILINAHKNSIETVVRNLISNSIKFTPSGGTITVDAKRMNGQVLVSVVDTGVGMGPEILGKLFRIDTKHSTRGTADEKGTGLGLILCKDFVEKNGGEIGVTSELGKGSRFYFTIPAS